MQNTKNSYAIWGVPELVKLKFRIICATRSITAADLFTQMVERELETLTNIPQEKQSLIKRIMKRTVGEKGNALISEYMEE